MKKNRQLALERRQARLQGLSQSQHQGEDPLLWEQGPELLLTALKAFLVSAAMCNSHTLTVSL